MRGLEGMQYLLLWFTEPLLREIVLGYQRLDRLKIRDVASYGLNSNIEVLTLNVVVFRDRTFRQ